MALALARACPSSCIRLSSAIFSSKGSPIQMSVGRRISSNTSPSRLKARHLTAPVLKSHPVITLSHSTHRKLSAIASLVCYPVFVSLKAYPTTPHPRPLSPQAGRGELVSG